MCWQVCGWENTYCRREGRGPEVEALAQSAIAEHMGEPCADTPRMLIALVDIRTLVPALKLRGAHPPPVALAAPQGGQNDSADQRARRAGQTTQCPVCSCSGRASREARGISAATGTQWQRRTALPGRHLDPPVAPAALEPYGNGGRRPRGGNGYVEPPLPQLKIGGVGQRAQNVDTSTLGWGGGVRGTCTMVLTLLSCRSVLPGAVQVRCVLWLLGITVHTNARACNVRWGMRMLPARRTIR